MCSVLEKNHNVLMNESRELIRSLIENDQYLSGDIPCIPSFDDILDKIGLQTGKKILVEIWRGDQHDSFKVAVDKEYGTLYDLKKAIQREYENKRKFHKFISKKSNIKNSHIEVDAYKKISWKYIWRTYALQFEETQLVDNSRLLVADYGLQNQSILKFVKFRKKQKNKPQ